MPELDSPAPGHTVLRGLSYFEYQRRVCNEVVVPWLSSRMSLTGLQVADFGAHEGGMLDALRESGSVAGAVGLELSLEVVESSPFTGDERFRLEQADIMAWTPERELDLVLLHDVVEHIPDYAGALDAAARALRSGGHVFVSFPPYYSAFGGHQQLAAGRARVLPFVHLLPSALFFRLARPAATEYMTADGALDDMRSVRRTRLTLGSAEQAFEQVGLEVADRELFVVRPEYTVRYGMRARPARLAGRVPLVRELAVNGAFYLLRRRR